MTKRIFNLIVAHDNNLVIGNGLDLPWKQSEDLKRLKQITIDNIIVMGYNTYLSLNKKPLKNRTNVVVVDGYPAEMENGFTFVLYDDFYNLYSKYDNVFIFGGAKTYARLLPYVKTIYLTNINTSIKGENLVYFPKYTEDDWVCLRNSGEFANDENNEYPYTFKELVHISNLNDRF